MTKQKVAVRSNNSIDYTRAIIIPFSVDWEHHSQEEIEYKQNVLMRMIKCVKTGWLELTSNKTGSKDKMEIEKKLKKLEENNSNQFDLNSVIMPVKAYEKLVEQSEAHKVMYALKKKARSSDGV